MMIYELPFLVMINTNEDVSLIKQKILASLPEVIDLSYRSVEVEGQRIEIRRNELADPLANLSANDGFLNFPIRIEVTPQSENQTINKQIMFARKFNEVLKDLEYQPVLCADFEELL